MPVTSRERDGPPVREWMERHDGELRRHLEGMLGKVDEAEDVLQELWITAHRSPPHTGPDSNVRAWLYRVATNAALDRLDRERRRRSALVKGAHHLVPDGGDPPDSGVHRLDPETRRAVLDHWAMLPEKQRAAVWLRWADGRDYEDVAERLESSVESARANVYHGLKRLRRELSHLKRREGER